MNICICCDQDITQIHRYGYEFQKKRCDICNNIFCSNCLYGLDKETITCFLCNCKNIKYIQDDNLYVYRHKISFCCIKFVNKFISNLEDHIKIKYEQIEEIKKKYYKKKDYVTKYCYIDGTKLDFI